MFVSQSPFNGPVTHRRLFFSVRAFFFFYNSLQLFLFSLGKKIKWGWSTPWFLYAVLFFYLVWSGVESVSRKAHNLKSRSFVTLLKRFPDQKTRLRGAWCISGAFVEVKATGLLHNIPGGNDEQKERKTWFRDALCFFSIPLSPCDGACWARSLRGCFHTLPWMNSSLMLVPQTYLIFARSWQRFLFKRMCSLGPVSQSRERAQCDAHSTIWQPSFVLWCF